jgi:Tfp pilus assembly protein PilF
MNNRRVGRLAGHGRAASGLAAMAIVISAGCATRPKASATAIPKPREASPAVQPALADLNGTALDERRRPMTDAKSLPPPPGLGPDVQAALAPVTDAKATMSLDAALAQLAPPQPAPQEPVSPKLDEDTSENATRHYIAARQKLLEGDAPGAIADLKETLRLDPSAGEAWKELAEAQLASGSKSEAAVSLAKAEASGVRDASVLEMLGRMASERGDHTQAIRWFARGLAADPAQADPLLQTVLEFEAARSLSTLGYHAASRDMLVRMLGRTPAMTASSRYMQEYGAIFRRQGELWREVGDDEMRLGNPGAALAAYEQAVLLPTLDGQSSMPRLVYAAMQSGRPAEGAVALLQRITEAGGRPTAEDLALLAHVARVEPLRRQLSAALGQLRASLGPTAPTLAADLARAQAAVAPSAEARRILAEHLVSHPRDVEAATLMASLADDAAVTARLAAATASAQPASASSLAEGILRGPHDPAAVIEELRNQGGPGASLLRAELEFKRGFAARADDIASGISPPASMVPTLALLRAESGIACGRASEASAALALLNGADQPNARARARILALQQRDREALESLAPVLDGPAADAGERLEDLLLASQLAVILERPEDAERWLRAAAALDPGDDRALGALLDLYGPGGPRADTGKQAQVVRELRQEHADGRVLRAARAADMIRRSAWAPAEREALQLAAEVAGERAPIELLTAIWTGRSRTSRDAVNDGLQWLDQALQRRPLEPMLIASKVTLLAAADRSEDAEIFLRKGLADGGSEDLSRLLERLLRDHLKQPDQANALAQARLENRERVLAESLELAEVYVRLDRPADAAGTALGALRPELSLLPDQKVRLTIIAAAAGQEVLKLRGANTPDEAAERQVRPLIDLVAAGGQKLPWAFHEIRLILKAAAPDASADDLIAACELAKRQQTRPGEDPVETVVKVLTQYHRSDVAYKVIQQLLLRPGQDAPELYKIWYSAIGAGGTASDLKLLVASDEKSEQVPKLVEWLHEQQPADAEGTNPRAEAAYILGNIFTRHERPEEANRAFELALEYQPNHPWALNNLGYYIADKGGDLARAEKLLEKASETLPNEPAVLDSLGWLRYKQNFIDDERDATGAVTRRGAVSLLQAAAMTDHGQQDPTIMNHLGDALWVAGRKTEAQRFWSLAQATATQIIQVRSAVKPRANDPAPDNAEEQASKDLENSELKAVLTEYKSIAESCAQKRAAAASGAAVRVAPQAGNADPQPRIAKQPQTPESSDQNTPPPIAQPNQQE